MKENRDKFYLERILESIDRIDEHVEGYDFEKFAAEIKTYDAVLMQFINIGEMINRLSSGFRDNHDSVNWYAAIGMRNEVAHGYYSVKPEVVWKTITDDLPRLKEDVVKILDELS